VDTESGAELTDETATAAPETTPEAPYGYKADGTPRGKPGRRAGQTTGTGMRRRRTAAKVDYATPIVSLFSIPSGACALAAAQLKSKPLAADAAAIDMHAPQIAQAFDQLAQEQPQVAAVLDKVLQGGPYVIVFAACLPLVLQLTTNHGMTPPGIMGAVHPDALVARYAAQIGVSPNGDTRPPGTDAGNPDHPA
jgi:hypothetical protein